MFASILHWAISVPASLGKMLCLRSVMTDYLKLNSKLDEHYTETEMDQYIGRSLNRHVDLRIVYIFVDVGTSRLYRSS